MLNPELMETILQFRKERDWEQFHTPKNLAISAALEAAELLEIFQWAKEEEIASLVSRKRPEIEEEIADVFVYLLLMCHDLQIDPERAIFSKMKKNAQKYPIEKSRGKSDKYTEF
ncbi:MAG TPA: nucleotide pyrophosphohydrolase [Thermotogota bacterium]|nr:nucleotide pyrophosphohydrolase [Thermotogota bacterium]